MSSIQLGLDLISTFLIAAGLLFYYGNWYHHPIPLTLTTLIAWYFSFIFVLVLPLDISSTVYLQCLSFHNITGGGAGDNGTSISHNSTISQEEYGNGTISDVCEPPASFTSTATLPNLWRVVYWTSQALTWILLPFMSSYIRSGEFRVKEKLKGALLDNVVWFGFYLFICGVLMVYLVSKEGVELDWQKLKAIAASAGNSWGLFVLVFLLGHGLVSIPLSLYRSSSPSTKLSRSYFKIAKLSQERNSAEEQLEDVVEAIQAMSRCTRYKKEITMMETLIPLEYRERMQRRNRVEEVRNVEFENLVRVHRDLKKALQNYHRVECQWGDQVGKCVLLEDVERCRKSGSWRFEHSWEENQGLLFRVTGNQMDYLYRVLTVPVGLKVGAAFTAVLSALVIWSETTFFIKSPVLSVFAAFLNGVGNNYAAIEFVSTGLIAYLAICAYYTIFRIRVFNFYYLAGRHQTDETSLIFCGMLLCRITPPLCLNALSLFHLDSHVIKVRLQETAYTQIMGHMDVLDLISDGFNVYFPVGILVVAILTWWRVGDRILSAVGWQQYGITQEEDDIMGDMVGEGVELVKREKRRRRGRGTSTTNVNPSTALDRGTGRSSYYGGYGDTERESSNIDSNRRDSARYEGRQEYQPPRGLFDDV